MMYINTIIGINLASIFLLNFFSANSLCSGVMFRMSSGAWKVRVGLGEIPGAISFSVRSICSLVAFPSEPDSTSPFERPKPFSKLSCAEAMFASMSQSIDVELFVLFVNNCGKGSQDCEEKDSKITLGYVCVTSRSPDWWIRRGYCTGMNSGTRKSVAVGVTPRSRPTRDEFLWDHWWSPVLPQLPLNYPTNHLCLFVERGNRNVIAAAGQPCFGFAA